MFYRGDIVWVSDSKGVGSEQRGERPALIVSNDAANEHAPIVTVVWLTTADKKPLPTHCEVKATEKSTALCESVVTISKERIVDYIRTVTDSEMAEVERCLMIALGLTPQQGESVTVYDEPLARISELVGDIDELFYKETDNAVAAGIDKANGVVRQMYRRICAEGRKSA